MMFGNKNAYLFTGIAIVLLFLVANVLSVFKGFEHRTLDLFRTPHVPRSDIVIVAIDNKSIEDVGRFPWDRKIYADFLAKLSVSNPRIVAFDVNFSEAQDEPNDSAFRDEIERSKHPIVLSSQIIYTNSSNKPERLSIPIFINEASRNTFYGHVNASVSEDGLSREFPKVTYVDNEEVLPFAYQIAKNIGAGLPDKSRLLIDFAGKAGTFTTVPFSRVLKGEVGLEYFEDKIVIVGATASDLRDYVLAPVENTVIAGAEWHANVLDNVLQKRYITLTPTYTSSILGLIFSLVILLIPLRVKKLKINLLFIFFVFFLAIASYTLWQNGIALFFGVSTLSVLISYILRSGYIWYMAEEEKRKLRKTIDSRFSPQVVEAILRDRALLKLGGVRKEVTVLFSDIRGFTTISESISPEQLSELLHEYFTEMTEEVLATNGVLDKFIGDAVMAFWGAPLDQKDQADRAVKTALGMIKRLEVLQAKWQKANMPHVDIGIGIHTGEAIVGNMGSEKRFDYTVIGDTVNIASRLEGLNKEYKTHCIISEATLSKITLNVETKPLGEAMVKGKTKGINIFEVG